MRRALDETDRRRQKQIEFNAAHGITPQGIRKAVVNIIEGAAPEVALTPRDYARVAEPVVEYGRMSAEELRRKVAQMEKQMHRHARDLEFEAAARIRDQIRSMRTANLGLTESLAD
jgi:excinuclease ABC subunit B